MRRWKGERGEVRRRVSGEGVGGGWVDGGGAGEGEVGW